MTAERIGGSFIALFSSSYGLLSLAIPDLNQGAGLGAASMPQFLAVCGLILGACLVFAPNQTALSVRFERLNLWRTVGLLALMLGYATILRWAGFALATWLFLSAAFTLLGAKLLRAGLVSALVTALVYVLLNTALDVYLPLLPAGWR